MAEPESGPQREVPDGQPGRENLMNEGLRLPTGQFRREGDFPHRIQTERGDPFRALVAGGDEGRGGLGMENLDGMGVEGQQQSGDALPPGLGGHPAQDFGVPAMDAVEIADGDRPAARRVPVYPASTKFHAIFPPGCKGRSG